MPQLKVTVPKKFTKTASEFTRSMQKLMTTTDQLANQRQHIQIQRAHQQQINFNQHLKKLQKISQSFESMLTRSITRLTGTLGPNALAIVRTISVTAAATVGVITLAGAAVVGGGFAAFQFTKWLWDSMTKIGDSIVQDYVEAAAARTTIGGLRAYRTTFGQLLPSDPEFVGNMMQARGYMAGTQMSTLRLLGVGVQDSTDMMVQATFAAAYYMKRQTPGTELLAAQRQGLTSVFSVQHLMALKEVGDKELEHMKELYERYKIELEIPKDVKDTYEEFTQRVRKTRSQIQVIIAQKLADSKFTQALTALNKSLLKVIDIIMRLPLTKQIVETVARLLDDLATWLKSEKAHKLVKDIVDNVVTATKLFIEATKLLVKLIPIFHAIRKVLSFVWRGHPEFQRIMRESKGIPGRVPPPIARFPGRARFDRRIGIARPPGAPMIRPPIARYPGRERFDRRTGIARPPGAPKIAPYAPAERPKRGGPVEPFRRDGGRTGGGITGPTSVAELEKDPQAQAAIERFQKAFPNVPNAKTQIYSLVKGESSMGRDMVQSNQYAGYFQLGADEAYKEMGLTKQQFAALPFHEQMDAYTRWAHKNDPTGEKIRNLGLFNAASGMKWQNMPDDTVIYRAGSKEALANANTWGRYSEAGGDVTIGGIKRYYERNDRETQRELSRSGVPATKTEVPRTGPGTWSDLPSRPGHDPELRSVDPRLREVLSAGRDQFEKAHPGYRVTASSGRRYSRSEAQHGSETGAVDVMIIGPDGKEVDNRGNDPTGLYHEYARHSYGEMKARYPELQGRFAWGGAFGTQRGTGGGPPDLMHFDLGGERGHWTENQLRNLGPMPGVVYGRTTDAAVSAAAPGSEPPTAAKGSPGVIKTGPLPNQADRPDYYQGKIKIDGKEYSYSTGREGSRTPSAPFGTYEITPTEMGAWGHSVGAIGISHNKMWDPKLGRHREGIELHSNLSDAEFEGSAGCLAIPKWQYPAFKKMLMDKIKREGTQMITINPDGRVEIKSKTDMMSVKPNIPTTIPGATPSISEAKTVTSPFEATTPAKGEDTRTGPSIFVRSMSDLSPEDKKKVEQVMQRGLEEKEKSEKKEKEPQQADKEEESTPKVENRSDYEAVEE